MRQNLTRAAATLAVLAAASMGGRAVAAAASPAIQPFAEFVQELATAPAAAYVGRPDTTVGNEALLEEMRQHLLKLYRGVAVAHSVSDDGAVFDCIPIEQQPSVRLLGLTTIAEPPPPSAAPAVAAALPAVPGTAAPGCDVGTIPMRRITLDETARFKNLQAFFAKGPHGAGHPFEGSPLLNGGQHGYAHEFAFVNNYGGYSALSIWDPKVVSRAPKHEIFSLAQHWYASFGNGPGSLQTAEVGWQNYPRKYGTRKSVLFIYWTADDYQRTGCYNLDCPAFVQTDNNVALGGSFGGNYSQAGGSQYAIGIGYYFVQGNWWLVVNGNAIGYYPGAKYRGGPLTQFAQMIDMGGETVGYPDWPGMGSGQFAATGYGMAAYHAAIAWRDAADGLHAPSLTVSQPSPACWTATSDPAPGNAGWGTYFYFGGPGGPSGTC